MTSAWTPDDADGRAAYLAVALTPGIGKTRMEVLQDSVESPHGALTAPLAFLGSLRGFSGAAAAALHRASVAEARRVVARTEALGARVLLPHEADFPERLRTLSDAPLALFVQGDPAQLAHPAVAVVGSRDHSPYGEFACEAVVDAALQAGAVVVSGMARGIDTLAHRMTLDRGGVTVGVLGNGFGVVYPAANRDLYDAVAERGVLVSEFPPGERPRVHSFPRRNRLVSGLARVVVVVEAALKSGALITARCALEQGRDLLAVPGPITSPTSVGANGLLRDGGAPFVVEADLWDRLDYRPAPVAGLPAPPDATARPRARARPLPPGLTPVERRAAEFLTVRPMAPEELAGHLRLGAGDTLAIATALELRGLLEALPGPRFRRIG
jgi:DNA processing protein